MLSAFPEHMGHVNVLRTDSSWGTRNAISSCFPRGAMGGSHRESLSRGGAGSEREPGRGRPTRLADPVDERNQRGEKQGDIEDDGMQCTFGTHAN